MAIHGKNGWMGKGLGGVVISAPDLPRVIGSVPIVGKHSCDEQDLFVHCLGVYWPI